MNKKSNCRLLSVVVTLSLTVFIGMTTTANAESIVNEIEVESADNLITDLGSPLDQRVILDKSQESWEIGQIDGYIEQTSDIDTFFKNAPKLIDFPDNKVKMELMDVDPSRKSSLSDLVLSYEKGKLALQGLLSYD
jgi:hypothetical protein